MIWLIITWLFIGFAIGRIGHIYGGHLNTPDHWIYGILAILFGILFYEQWWSVLLITFGVGHAVSDLKDMLKFKLYGPDEPGNKRFWHID